MSLPDQTPKLPKIPFLLGDVALLGAAWYIAHRDPGPLSLHAIAAITACVVFAAILGAIPFLTDYARKQDEALDERQRGLEALSRTINTAAEQISIAANGLNELTDLTHKNLKQADQLPHRLQDKIAEFNAQLNNARQDDREELEKELVELRTSETERLQAISDKVHKAIGELTKFDASLPQQANHRTEQIERAHAAFTKTHADATAALSQAHASLTRDFADRQAAALADLDRKLAERAALVVSAIETATTTATVQLHAATTAAALAGSTSESPADPTTTEHAGTGAASPPKRPRRARREDVPPVEADSSTPPLQPGLAETTSPIPPPEAISPALADTSEVASIDQPSPEPAPIPGDAIKEIQPVAPVSADPFSPPLDPPSSPQDDASNAPATAADPDASEERPPVDPAPVSLPEKPVRKRSARAAAETTLDMFGFSSEESVTSDDAAVTSADMMESVISSDGATRLITIAYIGIGNRLFIRGDGPGLSWEKGVPLQFVSIGKWRWETTDAAAPIAFKLYKNDETECPGLGTLVLEPGHQQEVTAKF